jgi:GNAT superfamily N-acetyltransferase
MHPNFLIEQTDIRLMEPGDDDFVFHSWLTFYRESSRFAKHIKNTIFFERHHRVIERILKAESTKALVCCSKDDPHVIYGYLIFSQLKKFDVVHMVYVKESFRRLGIAKALFEDAELDPDEIVFTHRPDRRYAGDGGTWSKFDWIEKKYPGMQYDPYLI